MSYWDIDQFLAEEQKVTCSLNADGIGMQFLDPTKGKDGNIDAHQEIQIPIWLVSNLEKYLPKEDDEDILNIRFPNYLHSKQFANRIKSFEICHRNSTMEKVNLEKQSRYLYETFLLLQEEMESHRVEHDPKLVGKLLNLRGKCILARASNYTGNMNVDHSLNTYTDFQSTVYKITKRKMEEVSAWKYCHKWLNEANSLNKNTKT